MKFGFTMQNGDTVDIKNINSEITLSDGMDYNNNKLKNSNYIFFNGKVGKEISFTSVIPNYEMELLYDYRKYWEYNTEHIEPVIIYYNLLYDETDNYLDSNPNYYWTNFEATDSLNNMITITWTFVEYNQFKPSISNFRIWSKVQTKSTNKTTSTVKTKNNPSNNTKLLLSKCGDLKRDDNHKYTCVKYLQKFLKAGGYYKGYKTDGIFSYYTQKELKKAQKKNKLPQTGKWDALTRCYYIIKYQYPSKTYTNIINGKSFVKSYKKYKKLFNKK